MKDLFENVLNEYQAAYRQQYTNHRLARDIRQKIPDAISQIVTEKERYSIKGSAGAGNWASVPWIAIFDILITDTVQSGYYPVFLFRDDMSGFYLSLNQGVTEIKEKYKSDATQVLKLKAEDFRAQLDVISDNFIEKEIELRKLKSTASNLASL